MIFKFLISLLLISFISCSNFVKIIDDTENSYQLPLRNGPFSLTFSHNINGETHSCGCRQFPLGGMSQVAGKFYELKKNSNIIYLDTGDTFFPSATIPLTLLSSQMRTAEAMVRLLNQLDLKYMVPGDQDFAAGDEFLRSLLIKAQFKFLISNLKNFEFLPHQHLSVLNQGNKKLFLIGLVSPSVMSNTPYSSEFLNPIDIFPTLLNDLKNNGYDSNNINHKLIVLSHSGYDEDEKLAQLFPMIDWIIGAHTQKLIQFPMITALKTKNVQVLSRNHYIGEIHFDFEKSLEGLYSLHEIRDDLKNLLPNNPIEMTILNHKKEIDQIQVNEQDQMLMSWNNSDTPLQTFGSCIECHQKQVDFWQKTSHSLAFLSLIKSRESHNLTCIKCHSLGLNQKRGFQNSSEIVTLKNKTSPKDYWDNLENELKSIPSIRSLPIKIRSELSTIWRRHDVKYNIQRNFANVQCLNCHDISPDHPFSLSINLSNKENLISHLKNKCLQCHKEDQSPNWYRKNSSKLNELEFIKRLKKVACPKID